MTISLYTQKGYAALIGLLVATLIIALIVYGGSFFSKKSDQPMKSQAETYIEVKQKAEVDLKGIEEGMRERASEINQ